MGGTKAKNFIAGTAALLYTVLLIVYVKDVSKAVLDSVKVCVTVMIPSLYAFMVISGFIVSSNLYTVLSKPFSLISRYLFRIPPQYFSVFLIGSVGGYPVGARLLSELYSEEKIDKETAEQMLSYCYLAGPAFICGIAGVKLFSSLKAGMIIFAAIISANLAIAIISGFDRPVPSKSTAESNPQLTFDKLIKSVYDGAKGMFSICAIIVFFSSIICILEKTGVIAVIVRLLSPYANMSYGDVTAAIRSVIEISNISYLTPNNYSLMPLTASLLSFGGVCVIIQVRGIIGEKLSAKRFYYFRILATIISYFLCKLYVAVFNLRYVPAAAAADAAVRQNTPIPTIFLLIMTILLLSDISMEKKKKV